MVLDDPTATLRDVRFSGYGVTNRLLLIVVVTLALIAPARAGATPPGFFGISPQGALNPSDFELMEEAGVRSVRLPLVWSAVQPESPAVESPDWAGFDREVGLAAEHRIRILPFVSSSPSWVAESTIDLPVQSASQRRGWARFLREAVERYGPEGSFWEENPQLPFLPIRSWEIWNEENIVTFARPVDPVVFAKLVRLSGATLHRADPGSKAILGGFFGRPLQTPPNVQSGDFLSRLYRARDVKRFFDGIALHPYVSRAWAMRAEIANLRRVMRAHHDAATPLYVTELGWGSNSGSSRWEPGLYGQARELDAAFSLLSSHRLSWRIGGVWWFSWTDLNGSCQFCDSAGLLTARREAKPAWYEFNAWTGGDPETVPRAQFLVPLASAASKPGGAR